jgi:hypothetical protein
METKAHQQAAYKFGWIPDEEQRYEYANVFAVEKTTGPERLIMAPSAQQVSLMLDLIEKMAEPFGVLYILVVPRGKGETGRYQNAEVASRVEAKKFLSRFRDFFENDARHHIWIASMANSDMLVYDNHNVIYAYGRLPEFERILVDRGLTKTNDVKFPCPHSHKYNEIFDTEQQEVLRYWKWKHSPLRDEDD